MGDAPTLFTRGQPGDADTRGESMVVKHLAKQKAAAEAEALAGLTRVVPGVGETLLRTALEACDWDVAAAQAHLRDFMASSGGGKRSASSSSGSESDSGSRSGRKRKRKDEKKSKREKHHKKSKRAKKERKEERKRPGVIVDGQFGKYGVVKETDLWEKQPEFNLWLAEVKQRNSETLQKWEERDMFKEFMEDYNTATMPHKKFYNLNRWHAKEAARAAKHGGAGQEAVSFGNLEEERRRELAAERDRSKGAAGVSLIEHMRLVGKLDGLREQQTLQKQLQLASQIGDHEKVKQLQAKLAPDDPRKSAAAQNYGFRPSR